MLLIRYLLVEMTGDGLPSLSSCMSRSAWDLAASLFNRFFVAPPGQRPFKTLFLLYAFDGSRCLADRCSCQCVHCSCISEMTLGHDAPFVS